MKLEKDITSSRIKTADLLKGIAAILMIQVHIIELFATNDISESTAGKFLLFLGGPAVAPVFIILLGYQSIGNTGAEIFFWWPCIKFRIEFQFNLFCFFRNKKIRYFTLYFWY